MQNPINLYPITQFIQQVRAAELSQSKEIKMNIQQARLLTLALSEIMDKMNRDYESMYNDLKKYVNTEDQNITIIMDGGDLEV